MSSLPGQLPRTPLPALLLMVAGAVLAFGAEALSRRLQRLAGRALTLKFIGLALTLAGAVLIFI